MPQIELSEHRAPELLGTWARTVEGPAAGGRDTPLGAGQAAH